MKLLHIQAAVGTALLLLSSPCVATHEHQHLHRRSTPLEVLGRRHNHRRLHDTTPPTDELVKVEGNELKKRSTCAFPTNAGLVAVTPDQPNGGWAMSPNQTCNTGSYCPYACPPGEVMAQWSPDATAYVYPESMAGGLYCNNEGVVKKPFDSKPYCVPGTGTVKAKNLAGSMVAFCQTVLPGNEAMLIPTAVDSSSTLAVPDTSYWCGTSAHYYVNPPGISVSDGCIWSDGTQPLGNWTPYVAGANTDANGNTFAKLGWNPVFLASGLSTVKPTYGLRITCDASAGCNGLPCSISPDTDGIGGVTSSVAASGVGGANFCVVTVPKGAVANIEVFDVGGSSTTAKSSTSTAKSSTSQPPSTTSTSSSTSTTPQPTSTTPSSSATPTPTPTTSTTTSSKSSSTSSTDSGTYYTPIPLFVTAVSTPTPSPHILFENQTSISSGTLKTATTSGGASETSPIAAATSKKSSATENFAPSSIFSLIVMLAVASYIL